jgi:hypothetical protein
MERFLKRKNPPGDDQNPDGGTSRRDGRDDNENLNGGTSRRGGSIGNTNHTTLRSSRVSQWEVNFDELPYDPRIGEEFQIT